MRLRPSGNKGPVAVPFSAFSRYQRTDAWIWEHLALTRARPVAGDEDLCARISIDIGDILASPPPHDSLKTEIAAMRHRIAVEKPAKNIWDLKHISGGIIDIEFIAQYAVLSGLVAYQAGQTTGDILRLLPMEVVSTDEREQLMHAFTVYTDLSQMMSLCWEGECDLDQAPSGLVERVLNLAAQPDLARLSSLIKDHAAGVHALFSRLFQ